MRFNKDLHLTLKNGTSDSRKEWFMVGDYKKVPNEVGGMNTALPEEVPARMKELLKEYNGKKEKTFEDILDFHVRFERIHPFQDGNGRVGRLILFKECLKYNIVSFIIDDQLKMFYYRGLKEWDYERGYLMDTCLSAQDKYKAYLDYFRIAYENNKSNEIDECPVIEVSDQTCFGNYAVIEGKEYPTEIVYDFCRIFFKLDSIL